MNYRREFRKFVTGQYIYSGVRLTLSCVIPAVILAYFGILKEYFLFPLATSFVGLTDMPGPFVRRRNAMIFTIISFIFVALLSSLVRYVIPLTLLVIMVCGMFFTLIGVYGQRLATIGSFVLVIMGIFIDRDIVPSDNIEKNITIFSLGSVWFLVVFLLVTKIQPYKLASQMIGEIYIELAEMLKIKSKFYLPNPDFKNLHTQLINKQIIIKNHQEATRETVFKTRKIVQESTTYGRMLMMMLLNSFELHERLISSDNDYRKIQENFGKTGFLPKISDYLSKLSEEIVNIGVALQGGTKAKQIYNLDKIKKELYQEYFSMREKELKADNLENFMVLRQILIRVNNLNDEINKIYQFFSQDIKRAKSLSTGLDYDKFVPKEEKLGYKVFKSNLSFDSLHFRHALRTTVALLLGYGFSLLKLWGIGHSYWIIIAILSIIRPSYSITKSRNLLRLYGTIIGCAFSYLLLQFVDNQEILFFILLSSMILCFTFLRGNYMIAIFFMTIYVFLIFNFLKPGNINIIFKDRLLDTAIAGIITYFVTYFVCPIWEHTKNVDLLKISAKSNQNYFNVVIEALRENTNEEQYKLSRKDAMIALANLSDNFQRMLSDPKNKQDKMESIHQFVITTHLTTAYIASLFQFTKNNQKFPELDMEVWANKINTEFNKTIYIIEHKTKNEEQEERPLEPKDQLSELLNERKSKLQNIDYELNNDTEVISHLAEAQNIQELLSLIYRTMMEQRKIVEKTIV